VVHVACNRVLSGACVQSSIGTDVGKGAVSIVAPHVADMWAQRELRTWREEVHIPIVVIINEPHTVSSRRASDASLVCYVSKCSILFIVQEPHTQTYNHSEVGETVVIVIRCGARCSMQFFIKPRLYGHILELSVAQVVIEGHTPLGTVVGKKKIDPSVAVVIYETCTGPQRVIKVS